MSITIGEAARRLGIRTSTLRYYEERGLVRPAERRRGARRYGEDELRRVAFVQFLREQGMSLDDARVLLEADRRTWRAAVQHQLAELERRIETLQQAKAGLEQALTCPAEHPATECPYLGEVLDARMGPYSSTS